MEFTEKKIQIMGIVNITDDSFFSGSRNLGANGAIDENALRARIRNMIAEGVDILDVGACSTRPGSDSICEEEEWRRLEPAVRILREETDTPLSVDTFRPEIVEKIYNLVGRFIVNDVSGGCEQMWRIVAKLDLPYIAMHTRGTPKNMQELTDYDDVTLSVVDFFKGIEAMADAHGVKDWILDPGFGFAKTVEQNWELLDQMDKLQCFGKRILVGVSRKSFIYRPLGISPDEALCATQLANLEALSRGANILRVHDVAQTAQTIKIFNLMHPARQ